MTSDRTDTTPITGRNGVAVRTATRTEGDDGYRTYEIHQRQRPAESTEKIKPAQLISDAYRRDPYPLLEILRENYPCYRDWVSNAWWLTRYDDVTSVFTDDANFETRPKTFAYGLSRPGRDLNGELPVLIAEEACFDTHAEAIAVQLIESIAARGEGDLVRDFAARLPLELLCRLVDVPAGQAERFCSLYWQAQRGTSWAPGLHEAGRRALNELEAMIGPLLKQRSASGEDLLSACLAANPDTTPADVVTTLLERDHETLHGALANLWALLLTHPREASHISGDRRLMKLAYLETLRHSTPILAARRYARHEVERFGRLLPEGALVICSAAAANRDPRVFQDPDTFTPDRPDLAQREPRGQYRADGLASGIAFGLGRPSRYPAVPEDRPRSRYALIRDTAVTASMAIVEHLGMPELEEDFRPECFSLTLGEMYTCWQLPVRVRSGG